MKEKKNERKKEKKKKNAQTSSLNSSKGKIIILSVISSNLAESSPVIPLNNRGFTVFVVRDPSNGSNEGDSSVSVTRVDEDSVGRGGKLKLKTFRKKE